MSRSSVVFAAIALLGLSTTTGCHARFKRHAGTLGSVNTQVMVTGGPTVNVPTSSTGVGLIDNVANIGMAVGASTTAGKIRSAVDVGQMSGTLETSLGDAIGRGAPFTLATDDGAGGLLEIDIRDFGVDASTGVPDFRFQGVVKIYRSSDGWRVYRNGFRCSSRSGSYNAGGMVGIGQSAGGLLQLSEMEDGDIRKAFDQQAEVCGQYLVMEMRKHAGRQ